MSSPIRLAFSPDSDDLFMFWPLLTGKVSSRGYVFTPERADTEALNLRAERGDVDVIALSIAQYASVAKDYLLLPHGASVGRGYGPVVVASGARSLASLEGKRIGVPGLRTTAYLTLRLLLPRFEAVVLPISPYARVFDALRSGEVDAALVIHEGRLTFAREGFAEVADVGARWGEATGGLPLPLGGNAIRRGLGADAIREVSALCRESIAWSLDHRDEVMDALLSAEHRADVRLDRPLLDRYLAMYANEDTRAMASDVRQAVEELFKRGRAAGIVAKDVTVEYAP